MHPEENNQQACIDINECDMFSNLCVYGKCENIFGMFRCECDDGYKLDGSGGNCTDVDECESPQSCQYGTCVNTQGKYHCECPINHELVEAGNACVGTSLSLFTYQSLASPTNRSVTYHLLGKGHLKTFHAFWQFKVYFGFSCSQYLFASLAKQHW